MLHRFAWPSLGLAVGTLLATAAPALAEPGPAKIVAAAAEVTLTDEGSGSASLALQVHVPKHRLRALKIATMPEEGIILPSLHGAWTTLTKPTVSFPVDVSVDEGGALLVTFDKKEPPPVGDYALTLLYDFDLPRAAPGSPAPGDVSLPLPALASGVDNATLAVTTPPGYAAPAYPTRDGTTLETERHAHGARFRWHHVHLPRDTTWDAHVSRPHPRPAPPSGRGSKDTLSPWHPGSQAAVRGNGPVAVAAPWLVAVLLVLMTVTRERAWRRLARTRRLVRRPLVNGPFAVRMTLVGALATAGAWAHALAPAWGLALFLGALVGAVDRRPRAATGETPLARWRAIDGDDLLRARTLVRAGAHGRDYPFDPTTTSGLVLVFVLGLASVVSGAEIAALWLVPLLFQALPLVRLLPASVESDLLALHGVTTLNDHGPSVVEVLEDSQGAWFSARRSVQLTSRDHDRGLLAVWLVLAHRPGALARRLATEVALHTAAGSAAEQLARAHLPSKGRTSSGSTWRGTATPDAVERLIQALARLGTSFEVRRPSGRASAIRRAPAPSPNPADLRRAS